MFGPLDAGRFGGRCLVTERKQLWGRWVLVALVLGAAIAAFYAKRTRDKPYGISLGQDLKGGTSLRFASCGSLWTSSG